MSVVSVAGRGSRERNMERTKRTMIAQIPDKYRSINGQWTDTTEQDMDKNRAKRKRNVWEADKTFFERICTGHVTDKTDI